MLEVWNVLTVDSISDQSKSQTEQQLQGIKLENSRLMLQVDLMMNGNLLSLDTTTIHTQLLCIVPTSTSFHKEVASS